MIIFLGIAVPLFLFAFLWSSLSLGAQADQRSERELRERHREIHWPMPTINQERGNRRDTDPNP